MLKITRVPEIIEKDDISFIDDHLEFWEEDKYDFDCEVSDPIYRESIICNIGIKVKEKKYIVDCFDYTDEYQLERFQAFFNELKSDLKITEIKREEYEQDILTYYWRNDAEDRLYIAKYDDVYENPSDDKLEFYICVPFDTFIENIDKQIKQIENDIWVYKNQDKLTWTDSYKE